jgi:hypothetical protein
VTAAVALILQYDSRYELETLMALMSLMSLMALMMACGVAVPQNCKVLNRYVLRKYFQTRRVAVLRIGKSHLKDFNSNNYKSNIKQK